MAVKVVGDGELAQTANNYTWHTKQKTKKTLAIITSQATDRNTTATWS